MEKNWRRIGDYIYVSVPGSNVILDTLRTDVDLPQGARVKKLTCYHLDNNATDSAKWSTNLLRRPLASVYSEQMALALNDSAGQSSLIKSASDTSITNPVIDNFNYSYYFHMVYEHDYGSACCLQFVSFFGCTIQYELEEPSAH